MPKTIPELTLATAPLDGNVLVEVAVPSGVSPTGYVSRRATLTDVRGTPPAGGGDPHRWAFSGEVNVDQFGRFDLAFENYADIQPLLYFYESGDTVGMATLNVNATVSGYGNTDVFGSTMAQIIYRRDDYSYINYVSNDGLSNMSSTFTGTLPLTPPSTGTSTAQFVVTDLIFNNSDKTLTIKGGLCMDTFYQTLPPTLLVSGFVDITAMSTSGGSGYVYAP
jgi:hypothetical protein